MLNEYCSAWQSIQQQFVLADPLNSSFSVNQIREGNSGKKCNHFWQFFFIFCYLLFCQDFSKFLYLKSTKQQNLDIFFQGFLLRTKYKNIVHLTRKATNSSSQAKSAKKWIPYGNEDSIGSMSEKDIYDAEVIYQRKPSK